MEYGCRPAGLSTLNAKDLSPFNGVFLQLHVRAGLIVSKMI